MVLRPRVPDVNVMSGGFGDRVAGPDQSAQAVRNVLRGTAGIKPRLAPEPFERFGKDGRTAGGDVVIEEIAHQRIGDDAR